MAQPHTEYCPRCSGSGWWAGGDCEHCAGSGRRTAEADVIPVTLDALCAWTSERCEHEICRVLRAERRVGADSIARTIVAALSDVAASEALGRDGILRHLRAWMDEPTAERVFSAHLAALREQAAIERWSADDAGEHRAAALEAHADRLERA